jgi:hypothetical protein
MQSHPVSITHGDEGVLTLLLGALLLWRPCCGVKCGNLKDPRSSSQVVLVKLLRLLLLLLH